MRGGAHCVKHLLLIDSSGLQTRAHIARATLVNGVSLFALILFLWRLSAKRALEGDVCGVWQEGGGFNLGHLEEALVDQILQIFVRWYDLMPLQLSHLVSILNSHLLHLLMTYGYFHCLNSSVRYRLPTPVKEQPLSLHTLLYSEIL